MRWPAAVALVWLLVCSGVGCRPATPQAVAPSDEAATSPLQAEPAAPEGLRFTLSPAGYDGEGRLAGLIVEGRPDRLAIDLFLPQWAQVADVRLEEELVVVLDHQPADAPWLSSSSPKFVLECLYPPVGQPPLSVRFTDPRGNPLEQRLDLQAAIAVVRREVAPYCGPDFWALTLQPGCRLAWHLSLGHGTNLNARGDALVSGTASVDAMTGEILEYPAHSQPYPTRAWLHGAVLAGQLADGRVLFRARGGEWLTVAADGELEELAAEPVTVPLTGRRESDGHVLVYRAPQTEGGEMRLTLVGAGREEIDLAGRLAGMDPGQRSLLRWHQWWPGPGEPETLFFSLELEVTSPDCWAGRLFRYHLAEDRLEKLFILPEGAWFHVFPCGRVMAFGWNGIVVKDIPPP